MVYPVVIVKVLPVKTKFACRITALAPVNTVWAITAGLFIKAANAISGMSVITVFDPVLKAIYVLVMTRVALAE